MVSKLVIILFGFGIAVPSGDGVSNALPDGTVLEKGQHFEVWDSALQQWVEPLRFWQSYASRNGGRSYGQRRDYPPYAEAREHDTIIIELDQGLCLMEFFHSRWRRANDVRRWGDAFNDFGGCPDVFDD